MTSNHILVDLNSALFDELVFKMLRNEHALYDLEVTTFVNFWPDLIVNQVLCSVCAVSGCNLARALAAQADSVEVVTLEPADSDSVLANIKIVAAATNCGDREEDFSKLQDRIDEIRVKSVRIEKPDRPRVVMLNWLDSLFNGSIGVPK